MRQRFIAWFIVFLSLAATVLAATGGAEGATLGAGLAASAPQYVGKVLLHCTANGSRQVDPIVKYSATDSTFPSAHLHTPLGANAFSASMTPASMIAAGSSCVTASDHDALWFPTPLKPDGTPATLGLQGYYVGNNGYDITQEPPNGLRFIVGDSTYSGQFGHVGFICMSNKTTSHTIPTTASCPPGPNDEGYEMIIQSDGQCWYPSSGLGAGMGGAGGMPNITSDPQDACLAGGGQIIPLVILAIGVHSDGIGGSLSSDGPAGNTAYPGSTAHFDFVFGFVPAADGPNAADDPINLIDQQCLDDAWDTNFGTVSCLDGSNNNHPVPGVYQALPGQVGKFGPFVTS